MRRPVTTFVILLCLLASGIGLTGPAGAASKINTSTTAKLSIASIASGSPATLAGTVTPSRAGHKVALQRLVSSHWRTIAQKKLNKKSHYHFHLAPWAVGTYTYRVKKLKDHGYRTSVSRVRHLHVTPLTRYLNAQFPLAHDTGYSSEVAWNTTDTVNGIQLVKSSEFTFDCGSPDQCGAGWIEYSLGGKWASLTATLGLRDDSVTGSSARMEIFGDGRSLGVWPLTIGTTVAVNLPVAGVHRIRFQTVSVTAAHAVLGAPRISTGRSPNPVSRGPVTTFLETIPVTETQTSGDGYFHEEQSRTDSVMGGVYYGQSVYWQYSTFGCDHCTDFYSDWAISRAYNRVSMVLGLDDGQTPGSATITITGDGVPLWVGTVASGAGTPVTLGIAGVLRLRLTVHSNVDDHLAPRVVAADVRLLNP